MNKEDIFFDLDCTCPLRKKIDIDKILNDYKKKSKFAKIDDATHMVVGDKNDIFAEAIVKFLLENVSK